MRRVKIVCTIGPSTASKKSIHALIRAGMNVARLNFSHGTHESYRQVIEYIRDISRQLQSPVAILQDLQGIKIRVGRLKSRAITLKKGSDLLITPCRSKVLCHGFKHLRCCYNRLHTSVRPLYEVLLQ